VDDRSGVDDTMSGVDDKWTIGGRLKSILLSTPKSLPRSVSSSRSSLVDDADDTFIIFSNTIDLGSLLLALTPSLTSMPKLTKSGFKRFSCRMGD
jgi:hypothetical protein